MSQNCGSNAWWKQIAKPIRKLKRRRAKLLNGKPSHRAINEINEIEGLIFVYSSRAAAKQKSVRSEKKRRYCDVHLLLGEDWG
jgi:beta-galactosidase beta subunit